MKNKKMKVIVGSLLLISVIAGGFLYIKQQSKLKITGTGLSGYVLGNGIAPNLTEEEIQALLQKQVDESKIAFSINSEPVFNGKTGNIFFANPRYNAHKLDLEVFLDGKTIIKTEKISPDQYIKDIDLMGKALKKGKHKASALLTAYNKDTDEVVGQVTVELDITSA